jgi:hypothetical protein
MDDTTTTLHWSNFVQPDEGNEWTNSASFLSEDEAKRAAVALTSKEVRAAHRAVIQVFAQGDKAIARYEYADGTETMIFDDRVKPLFSFHGKLGDTQ